MTVAPKRAIAIAALVMIIAGLAWTMVRARNEPSQASLHPQRPALMLLTSLSLVFGEDFSLSGGGSPVLKALQTRYRVLPISTTSTTELKRGRVLLMAQPPAQTAENLVALDDWVRRGGRVLLLADPLLEWPSKLPLGDPSRPSPMFADTGLLLHWGLRLDAPGRPGLAVRSLGGRTITAASPGQLAGSCSVSGDGFVAHCPIGAGQATVVADADFLNVDALPPNAAGNIPALLEELANLESA